MNDLGKLEAQVKEMQAEIERLKSLPDRLDGICWRPEKQDRYYYAARGRTGEHTWNNDRVDNRILISSQLFKTKDEAQHSVDIEIARMKVLRRVAELNAEYNWVCNWTARAQPKFFPYFFFHGTSIKVEYSSRYDAQFYPTSHYAANGVWSTVMREMEADVKLGIFGVTSDE